MVLSLIGGIIGIILGYLLSVILGQLVDVAAVIQLNAITEFIKGGSIP